MDDTPPHNEDKSSPAFVSDNIAVAGRGDKLEGDGAKIIEGESSSLQSPVTPLGDDMVFSPVKDDTPSSMSWKRLSVTNATAPTAAAAATTGIAGIDNEEYAPPPPRLHKVTSLPVTVEVAAMMILSQEKCKRILS